jgi:protein TonB
MEVKKTAKADLTNKSNLFFSIGLIVALSLMLMSFEWTTIDEGIIVLTGDDLIDEDPIIIPVTDPKPPMPVVKQPKFEVVPEKEEIEEKKYVLDVLSDTTGMSEIPIVPEPDKEETEAIYTFLQESASPKGGMQSFYSYVSEKIKFPTQAVRMGIEGKVFVEFVVNKDGTLTDVKAVKGIGAGCDEEAVRVVKSAPAWNPGKQRGKPVRQRHTVPISFRLN